MQVGMPSTCFPSMGCQHVCLGIPEAIARVLETCKLYAFHCLQQSYPHFASGLAGFFSPSTICQGSGRLLISIHNPPVVWQASLLYPQSASGLAGFSSLSTIFPVVWQASFQGSLQGEGNCGFSAESSPAPLTTGVHINNPTL